MNGISDILSSTVDSINSINVSSSSDSLKSQSQVESSNTSQQKEAPSHQVNEKTVSKAVDTVNKKLSNSNAECKFGVHKATGQITVKVVDKATGDVIREIPSEKILDVVAKALEVAGILMDEKR